MILKELKKFELFSVKQNYDSSDFMFLDEYFTDNSLCLLKTDRIFKCEYIGEYEINSSYYSSSNSRYPDEALKIDLPKGEYVIIWKNGRNCV